MKKNNLNISIYQGYIIAIFSFFIKFMGFFSSSSLVHNADWLLILREQCIGMVRVEYIEYLNLSQIHF